MNINLKKIFINILDKRGFQKKSKFDKTFIDGALTMCLSKIKKGNLLRIIQVGANDGRTSDYLSGFLKKYGENISILFVEPQINLKAQLLANTKNICKKTFYEFVAVTRSKSKDIKLYVPKKEKMPNASLKASFEIEQIIKRFKLYTKIKNPILNKDYVAIKVQQKTLSELAKKWDDNLTNEKICDVLIVDAEGYDDEVIYSLDNKKKLPDLISFEWKNLSEQKYNTLQNYLFLDGFIVIKWSKADAVAIRTH